MKLAVIRFIVFGVIMLVFLSGCGSSPPSESMEHLSSGVRYLREGKKQPALEAFDRAVKASEGNVDVYVQVVGRLQQKRWFAESIPYLEKAIELTPTDSVGRVRRYGLYVFLGASYAEMKEYDKGESAYRTAVGLHSLNADAYNGWGYMLADANIKLDDALRLTKKAVELAPNSAHIVDSLGWTYYRLGRYEEAVKHLRRAVELDAQEHSSFLEPGLQTPELREHLSEAYRKTGNSAGALVEHRKAEWLKGQRGESGL